MRAEGDIRVLQLRVGALDDSDDIVRELGANDLVIGVDVERNLHARQCEGRQRLLRRSFAFQLLVPFGRMAEDELEK